MTETPATGLVNLEKELICFICTEILYQPRTLLDCLHTFCGSCLKEWFSHQHRKAAHTHPPPANPYTCPTCRASVKDVQRNATINTFLEMFLAANPGKDRTAEEKTEMAQIYKPGDEILPKGEGHRRRERKRREEEARGTGRVPTEGASRREQHLDPASAHRRRHTTESSRSRERREARDRQGDEERQSSDADGSSRRTRASSSSADLALLSPPPSSPRHPDAVEARQRGARTVAHQASLISLVSASESGTGTGESLNEAELMQEILDAGLLDGINVDELTEQEQDELSEIIAQRYRELHAERSRRAEAGDGNGSLGAPARPAEPQPEEAEHRSRRSSRGSNRDRAPPSPRTSHGIVIGGSEGRPPTSFLQSTADQSLTLPQPSAHRRRTSNESRRSDSSVARADRESVPHPAVRSATDLSNRPQSRSNAANRVQHHSHAHRANTEPRTPPRASEVWQAAGSRQPSSPARVESPGQASPRVDSTPPVMSSVTTGPVPTVIPTSDSAASAPEVAASNVATVSSRSEEPDVVCARCSRPSIQYEVHKHCDPCRMDLCLRCYRSGRGCNHWFGFGDAAMRKFNASRPPSRHNQPAELPHILVGRQYLRPPTQTRRHAASDPAARLREGNFCDRCGRFANDYFWTCDVCNEGEWGFCNDCVNTNHCCNHALLPVARISNDPNDPGLQAALRPGNATLSTFSSGRRDPSPAQSVASSCTSATGPYSGLRADFRPLVITTNCDVCSRSISPEETRFHCPTHSTPSPDDPSLKGDYDICGSCYARDVAAGRIKREDGPDGWRLCPKGHRMVTVVFERDVEGNQRRAIVRDIVGGVKLTDDDMAAWKLAMSNIHRTDTLALSAVRGEWSWREDEAGTRRTTRARTATLPQSGVKIPPDGGSGKICRARWSYYPVPDDAKGTDELAFPKYADVCEVEEINDEWWHGVYAGDAGLFPAIFVRDQA
ncbi:RING finger domain-containing protein [Cladophialophora carrionii]|uniref:RING finger domain-containing protein n=1 Tax=Cladophialophora carrionii TaxID=86049 RepID=A0A1C1C6R4_9EURO|nr:RING finger domain-containing protein [Cladophialophora carrionii]